MKIIEKQIYCEGSEISLLGIDMLDALLKKYPALEELPAGNVMVFVEKTQYGTSKAFFELLQNMKIEKLTVATLMYYEPGSIIYEGASKYTPITFKFGKCRFPNSSEINYYNKKCRL